MITRLERLAAKAAARLIHGRVVVAVSGGPDSQALLHVLAHANIEVVAAGIDHGLRPDAAQELEIAETLAGALGVTFVKERVTLEKGNVLAAARKARYAALDAIADKHGATHIAVGHTATDQLETVLLHLIRGDGVTGKLGMRARNGRIVRPLLKCTRDDVLAYLDEHAIAYASDPSNSNLKRSRARIRAEVLPVLKALNPRIETAIGDWATTRYEESRLLDGAARRLLVPLDKPLGSVSPCLDVTRLRKAPHALRMRALKAWLGELELTPARRLLDRIDRALSRTQARITASQATFFVDASALWVVTKKTYDLELTVPGEVVVPNSQLRIVTRLDEGSYGGYGAGLTSRPQERAVALDADDLHFQLRVRGWRAGDRIVPFGHGEGFRGSVKIGDLFTNAKVPRAMRADWPVVTHGSEIIWVVGLRRGGAAPITPRTRRILSIEVLG